MCETGNLLVIFNNFYDAAKNLRCSIVISLLVFVSEEDIYLFPIYIWHSALFTSFGS